MEKSDLIIIENEELCLKLNSNCIVESLICKLTAEECLYKDENIALFSLTEPQGVLCHMLRDVAAKKPGTITHVGFKTFVDPRNGGGKLNERTTEDLVELVYLGGKEYLIYKSFPITFPLLRGTYADENGNITMEHEGMTCSVLSAAQAVKNCGGKVVVQVEQIVKSGTLNPKLVKIPGIYVDAVVVAQFKENHMQTFSTLYNPSFSGEIRTLFMLN